jgi:hypothetical protein
MDTAIMAKVQKETPTILRYVICMAVGRKAWRAEIGLAYCRRLSLTTTQLQLQPSVQISTALLWAGQTRRS